MDLSTCAKVNNPFEPMDLSIWNKTKFKLYEAAEGESKVDIRNDNGNTLEERIKGVKEKESEIFKEEEFINISDFLEVSLAEYTEEKHLEKQEIEDINRIEKPHHDHDEFNEAPAVDKPMVKRPKNEKENNVGIWNAHELSLEEEIKKAIEDEKLKNENTIENKHTTNQLDDNKQAVETGSKTKRKYSKKSKSSQPDPVIQAFYRKRMYEYLLMFNKPEVLQFLLDPEEQNTNSNIVLPEGQILASKPEENPAATTHPHLKEMTPLWQEEENEYPKRIGDTIILGPNGTTIDSKLYYSIHWSAMATDTRKLLCLIFSNDILGTHTLNGNPALDPLKIADIYYVICSKFKCSENDVEKVIKDKCKSKKAQYKRMLKTLQENTSG